VPDSGGIIAQLAFQIHDVRTDALIDVNRVCDGFYVTAGAVPPFVANALNDGAPNRRQEKARDGGKRA
jgi:hypothetical protein